MYKKETLHIASEWMKYFMAKQTVMGDVSNSCAPILPRSCATPQYYPHQDNQYPAPPCHVSPFRIDYCT